MDSFKIKLSALYFVDSLINFLVHSLYVAFLFNIAEGSEKKQVSNTMLKYYLLSQQLCLYEYNK